MKPLTNVRGRVIPLPRANIDTDQIIPARHLKRLSRAGLGRYAFEAWRRDRGFPLNDPSLRGAPILLAGPNFGCGSSREHAPWALEDLGVRVIIAPSVADIFRQNCARVGVLTIELARQDCILLLDRAELEPEAELVVDLASQTLVTGDATFERRFEVDPFTKRCLLGGLDPIALTLESADAIAAFERRRPAFAPRTILEDR